MSADGCVHRFVRHGKRKIEGYWLRQPWWRCVPCDFETRSYDAADRMAMRPVHKHMSVALPGYNTVEQRRG